MSQFLSRKGLLFGSLLTDLCCVTLARTGTCGHLSCKEDLIVGSRQDKELGMAVR